jgi:integrase
MKLSQQATAALKLDDGKRDAIYFDQSLGGFGYRLRAGANGKTLRSWVLQYKRAGRTSRITLGDAAVLSAEAARTRAKKLLGKLANGEDPARDRRERRAKDALTVRSVVGEYLAAKQADLGKRTFIEVSRYLTDPKYFGPLHRQPIDQIMLRDVAARLLVIKRECGNATAVRARSALRAFFSWSMRQGLAAANPTIGSEAPQTQSRDKVLTPEELRKIWLACGDDDYGKIVKLLVLTGCRRAEIGNMRRSELDTDSGTLTIGAERTKTGKPRVIPLLPVLLEIISDVPKLAGRDALFGMRGPGFGGWGKCKAALDARSGTSGWVIHDLRRSVATIMAEELAVPPHIVELVLGHEFRSGVQATYNRAPYAREIRDAYLRWHDYLRTLIDGKPRKVIPFGASGREIKPASN